MHVTVISPEAAIFDGEADAVTAPAYDGSLGVLPRHAPMMTLLGEGELSVQELEKAVGVSQSSVSQHLGLLKDKEILESRRVAQQVFYRLRDARLLQLTAITRELFCRME